MDNDDQQIGRILSRREVLALLGAAGAGFVAGGRSAGGQSIAATEIALSDGIIHRMPACVVRPAQTEGPYFVDEKLNRSDIRSDPGTGANSEGALLDLEVGLSRVSNNSCAPLAGAIVDVWQCDAVGIYSDVRDTNGLFDTKGKKFLRGHQVTGADGIARFRTIFPGWYEGRTTHVHFKVRVERAGGRAYDFTSQLYFDDAVADGIFTAAPYVSNKQRRVTNDRDGIFRRGGKDLLVALERRGAGYQGRFDVGLEIA
jgi:protocatechuate 3,4-dioxygenase beta subunit